MRSREGPTAASALCSLIIIAAVVAISQPLQAGSAPFDNDGRIQCDERGLINASERKAQRIRLPVELSPGEMVTIPAVCPAEPYFPTGVLATPGASYQIDAQGLWKDGWIKVGPEGWRGLLLEAGNRLRWKPFFLLSGSIGPSDGQLFANDWPGMLHNNSSVRDADGGPLRVTIRRID